jgi:hypothetical protein
MSKYLAQVPINGYPLQNGGQGCELSYEWLEGELKKGNVLKENEVISQINVTKSSIVLYTGIANGKESN